MISINRIVLTGHLTRDPEVRTLTDGETKVANFSIAVNGRKNKAGKQPVDFFDCVAWRGLAGICEQYLTKGSLVGIEGQLHIETFEDKSGNQRSKPKITIDNMVMLDKRQATEDRGSNDEMEGF